MSIDANNAKKLVISYRLLQRLLGLLGLALPAALLLFTLVSGRALERSISDFYYTQMGGFLVGTLSAVGVFLLCYNGFPDERPNPGLLRRLWADRTFSLLAGIGAIGVALFPVYRKGFSPPLVLDPETQATTITYFGFMNAVDLPHYVSAVLFFVCITVLVVFFFPRGEQGRTKRKMTYYLCGLAMIGSLLIMLTYFLSETKAAFGPYFLFIFESIAVLAFALAWLAKGKTDEGVSAGLSEMKRRVRRE